MPEPSKLGDGVGLIGNKRFPLFFEDNAAKKRWVLKLDNPDVLA